MGGYFVIEKCGTSVQLAGETMTWGCRRRLVRTQCRESSLKDLPGDVSTSQNVPLRAREEEVTGDAEPAI